MFIPNVVFVDSRDGNTETTVFDFCSRAPGLYPIKGTGELKMSEQGHKITHVLDEATPRDRDRFRLNKKFDTPYVLIATNWYKRWLYTHIKTSIKRKEHGLKGNNYCDFPVDYPDKYFDMLVAEEERSDHTFWKPTARANESLDLRVYNLCAGEFWLWTEVQRFQRLARQAGQTKSQSELIHSSFVLAEYERVLARKPVTPVPNPAVKVRKA